MKHDVRAVLCTESSHWKELMEKTGQTFDMNAETFTLQNIFAMELHRFQDRIGEIVNCAIKELAIEKVSLLRSCPGKKLSLFGDSAIKS